ncbi:hypothetical protein QNI16_31775 [Cytophagaceae bacterium YF14B1]|uniref:Uncharacterized protein n=1 Tax=Xanthocytophaga flava TaxID=3048013 RepID=A0AAE3QUB5_9BACT|nr:hypothetical protein [Xanthocytophaga flavus]MDJ1471459.1 hypothetical protein [Xanthocytophaga flavus]MDJ1485121.1 hypothetical protein [Xanthocytophaga flavus]
MKRWALEGMYEGAIFNQWYLIISAWVFSFILLFTIIKLCKALGFFQYSDPKKQEAYVEWLDTEGMFYARLYFLAALIVVFQLFMTWKKIDTKILDTPPPYSEYN